MESAPCLPGFPTARQEGKEVFACKEEQEEEGAESK